MSTRTIADIASTLATQDNECTVNPMFVVQKHERIWGLSLDYVEDYVWVSVEDFERHEADEKTTKQLEQLHQESYDDEIELDDDDGCKVKWTRVGYRDQWVFVTACLTRVGCEEYLRLNGHNLGKTRIMVDGEVRNKEWETLRAHIARVPHVHAAIKAASQAHVDGNKPLLADALGALMAIITHAEGCPP
jgi:hypothetical protein